MVGESKTVLQEAHQDEAAQNDESGQYAVKLQSKYKLIKNGYIGHAWNEIQLMSGFDHPFLVKMHGVGQDKRMVYLYLDYVKGGNLMAILQAF